MRYEILTYGHPMLRAKAAPVSAINRDLRRLIDDMMDTMHAASGVGLAAQQVGQIDSVCVIDVPADCDLDGEQGMRLNPGIPMPLVMFNPQIVARANDLVKREEGCLSFPGIHTYVSRPGHITAVFMNLRGQQQTITAQGLLARAIQHELDHLNGTLLVDRMSPVKKISLSSQLKRLKRETEAGLHPAPATP